MTAELPLTDEEELALALLLWRALRADFGKSGSMGEAVASNLPVTEKAEALARKFGVRREFFELLVKLPVLSIAVTNLDNDGKAKPAKAKPKNRRVRR